MPQEENNNNNNNNGKDKHSELVSWLLRGAVTVLFFAMWYFAEMASTTKDQLIAFKANTEQEISNEIGRSIAKDENQQKEIDKNTEYRERDHDMLITLMERTRHLNTDEEGQHGSGAD